MYDHSELLALQKFRRGTIPSCQCDSSLLFLTTEFISAPRLPLLLCLSFSGTGELSVGLSYALVRGTYRFAMKAIEQAHLVHVSVAMDVTSVLELDDISVCETRFVFWKHFNYPYT
jgi:hypothetical protein